jgi:hypothetical protein
MENRSVALKIQHAENRTLTVCISFKHTVQRNNLDNYNDGFTTAIMIIIIIIIIINLLCGLVVRVLSYRSGGPGSIPGTTREKSSRSGTGSTQPREYK